MISFSTLLCINIYVNKCVWKLLLIIKYNLRVNMSQKYLYRRNPNTKLCSGKRLSWCIVMLTIKYHAIIIWRINPSIVFHKYLWLFLNILSVEEINLISSLFNFSWNRSVHIPAVCRWCTLRWYDKGTLQHIYLNFIAQCTPWLIA